MAWLPGALRPRRVDRSKEHKSIQPRTFGATPWVDRVWLVATAWWAWLPLGAGWLLLLLVALAEPDIAPWLANATPIGALLRTLRVDESASRVAFGALASASAWRGWAVRALYALTAAWLLFRLLGEIWGWPWADERCYRELLLEQDWSATRDAAKRLASRPGWRVAGGDEDSITLRTWRPWAGRRRALAALVWVGGLLIVAGIWAGSLVVSEGMQTALAVGEYATVGRWGVQRLWLDRLTLQLSSSGTIKLLDGELGAITGDGEERSVRVTNGRVATLDGASLFVAGVGPAINVSASSLKDESLALAPMAGGARGELVRVRLGGVSQEHLVAVDDGRAVLRLLEGAVAGGDGWALLLEVLDGATGELVARHEIHPPDQVIVGDWLFEIAREYFLRLSVGPNQRFLLFFTRWAPVMGVLLVIVGGLARRRWSPQASVAVLGPMGSASRAEIFSSLDGQAGLIDQLQETVHGSDGG